MPRYIFADSIFLNFSSFLKTKKHTVTIQIIQENNDIIYDTICHFYEQMC